METENNKEKILKLLLKDISKKHSVTTLAKEIGVSRVGTWKILKKLQKEELIILNQKENGKTNIYEMTINWANPLIEKTLSLILTKDATNQKRWLWEFNQLEKCANFTILYGSILHSPEKANDIDLLNIVSKKNNFVKINKILLEKQTALAKKVHDINFTPKEFRTELKNQNKAFIHAIKTGIVLYGQENFVKFIRELIT